jgi:hypothetical protein
MDRFVSDDCAAVREHAVMVLVGAGQRERCCPLPPYAPELNPVERVRLYLRERYLSHRLHEYYTASFAALCMAWRKMTAECLRSLCGYPWIIHTRSLDRLGGIRGQTYERRHTLWASTSAG